MRESKSPRSHAGARRLGLRAILIGLAIGAQSGCTREFYRDWANQDVSEAVFEKSRDPRWRMDIFSVEPPMLSRFADPYDQDVPPAPPDDPAAEALSPVPQWPDNRLLMPVEGTGYLDLLEYWRRDDKAKEAVLNSAAVGAAAAGLVLTADEPEYWQRPDNAQPPVTDARPPGMPGQPMTSPAGPPVPATSSPFSNPPPLPRPGGSPAPTGPAGPAGRAPAPTGPQAANQRRPSDAFGHSDRRVIRLQDAGETGTGALEPRGKSQPIQNAVANSGTKAQGLTPISLSVRGGTENGERKTDEKRRAVLLPSSVLRPSSSALQRIPPPRSGSSFANLGSGGTNGAKDRSLTKASYQERGAPAQAAMGAESGMRTQILEMVSPTQGQPAPARPSAIPGQPAPGAPNAPQARPPAASPADILDRDIVNEPPFTTPAQRAAAGQMSRTEAAELSQVLVPTVELAAPEETYGYPKGSRVYKINMQQALLLAIMNARFYQFNLENVYLQALPVTLQRFAFEPQFYAGMSPTTSPGSETGASAGFPPTPGVNATNQFTYATRYSPTGQVSALNLGTVAGFGKLFSSGGQLLMGFANEVAFNFLSKNPQQPTVISALPISFVQPLLRGGGRAVVMEPLTQAERNLLYAVRAFSLFRQQFFVVTLTGGSIQNFGVGFNLPGFSATAGNSDPTVGFLPLVFNLVEIEVDRRNLFFLESLAKLYQELIQGEASGLSRLQVDQVLQRVIAGRQALFLDLITYRNQLDQFKMQMSLPPDLPLVVDMSLAQPFYDVFNEVDGWQRRSDRKLNELPAIIAKIPELEDIDIEGRSVLGPYRNYRSTREFVPSDEQGLEDLLQAAVRITLEYRMDLMNNRAALYDAWRQIRFTANALKGVLNLAITNNVYTPVASSNPFGFLSQAKQFGLTLNAELPLVRVNERNNFRTALINYQRLRRSLQTAEDNLKVLLRFDLRNVHQSYIFYEIAKRQFELNVRLKDQAFEAIIAPPAAGGGGTAQGANAAVQTTNLLTFQGNLINFMLALTNGWQGYQTNRLIVYRDIGILPYDEWEAFSELYPSQYHGPIIGHAPAGGAGFTPPPEARTATPESR